MKEANEAEEEDSPPKKKKKSSIVKFNDEIETKFIDEEIKEDIYGRMIDKKGNLIKSKSESINEQSSSTYVPPALRSTVNSIDNEEFKRRLQGQFNRLSEANFSSILTEIVNVYRSNSRAIVNSCLSQIYDDGLLSSIALTSDSRLAEHALLASLLHANIGLEIGSFLLEKFSPVFIEHINDPISNKKSDNLIILFSYFYAFHITNEKFIFDLGKSLLTHEEFGEKHLELILLLLKTIGFILRKEHPLELKSFLQELRTVCSSSVLISSSTKRLEFMMDTIKSLKNNDIRKLPGGYQPERIDRLRKIYRNLIEDKTHQQTNLLNVGLDDYLHVNERGRWWIVGSAWQKQILPSNSKEKPVQFNENIIRLAKQQHMNTDIRKLIFGTLLTSQVRSNFDLENNGSLSSLLQRIVMTRWKNFTNLI